MNDVSVTQWLDILKTLAVAFGLYMAIRVDLAMLKTKIENHEKEFARINRVLERE